MKKKMLFFPMMMLPMYLLLAQNPLSQNTQVEVGLGFARPFLQSGNELLRAQELRNDGLSYFENTNGERANVGDYPAPTGFSLTISYYKPIKPVKGLMLGATVRNSQTGSQPQSGGYAEGYFFNFITAGAIAKYYPFVSNNLYVKGDLGLAAVLTKNRFVNSQDEQNFFHQFGIGSGAAAGLGYSFTPFKSDTKAIELQATYQQLGTRVEVNGIGDDNWRFGALHLSVNLVL